MSDFTSFRFGNVHSEDLHLVVVSSSDRYEKNLFYFTAFVMWLSGLWT